MASVSRASLATVTNNAVPAELYGIIFLTPEGLELYSSKPPIIRRTLRQGSEYGFSVIPALSAM
ncbi:MAG: hypothetical protein ACM3U1_07390 [Chloroflexota bacterium]